MANYAYITLAAPTTPTELEERIKAAVAKWWGERFKVVLADFEDGGPTWLVTLPATAHTAFNVFGDDQDIGFTVALQQGGKVLAFRHGPMGEFERWAQGVVEEELSEAYSAKLYFDATDEAHGPGPRRCRVDKSFGDYMTRSFSRPIPPEVEAWLAKIRERTPDGLW